MWFEILNEIIEEFAEKCGTPPKYAQTIKAQPKKVEKPAAQWFTWKTIKNTVSERMTYESGIDYIKRIIDDGEMTQTQKLDRIKKITQLTPKSDKMWLYADGGDHIFKQLPGTTAEMYKNFAGRNIGDLQQAQKDLKHLLKLYNMDVVEYLDYRIDIHNKNNPNNQYNFTGEEIMARNNKDEISSIMEEMDAASHHELFYSLDNDVILSVNAIKKEETK